MLTMHNMKKKLVAPEPPQKRPPILTMRDVRRRSEAQRELVQQQLQEQEERRKYDVGILGLPTTRTAPQPFSHVMRNGAWKGHRAFVVGGGASLKGFDWDQLRGELVIGVNRAIEKFTSGIMFSMDLRLWSFYEKGELGAEAKEIFKSYMGSRVWSVLPGFVLPEEAYYILRPGKGSTYTMGTVSELDTSNNSGYGAMLLALALGASPVYLLGFDMMGDGKGKQIWWHDGYPPKQSENVYKKMTPCFDAFVKNTASMGLDIVNLSLNSKLTCFRKQDPAEVFKVKVKRPLVVNFYTHPEYRKLSVIMAESVTRYGMEIEVTEVADQGGWLKNVQYKAQFMLDKLLEHKRDILWLDSDSVMNAYPEVFDNFEGDIGVHYIDWARHTNGRRKQKELAGAVVYLAYNKKVVEFLKVWVKAVALEPKRYEQLTLQYTVADYPKSKKLKVVNLPAEYCTIFDSMMDVAEPIIEQFQASRRMRGIIGNG